MSCLYKMLHALPGSIIAQTPTANMLVVDYDLVRIQVDFASQVGKVQKQFIVKLLGQSSFSKHMSAVRETNNLLMRALDLRNTDDGNSIKVPTILMPFVTIPIFSKVF